MRPPLAPLGLWIIALFFILSPSLSASAATLVLQNGLEGYSGTEDTTIYNLNVDFSNGASSDMTAGRTGDTSPNPSEGSLHRVALKFDLSTVPTDVTILGVTLEIRVSRIPPTTPNNVTYTLHPILSDWNEGSINGGMEGASANAGDMTWSSNLFGTETWTTPGGDFGPASATQTVPDTQGFRSWSSPQLAQDVIDWIAQPPTNFGWMLVGDESGPLHTARGFNSSETNTASIRPRLILVHDGQTTGVSDWSLY